MINGFTIDALSVQDIGEGRYNVLLDEEQIYELYQDLTTYINKDYNSDKMISLRVRFLEEEGYMAPDSAILAKYVS